MTTNQQIKAPINWAQKGSGTQRPADRNSPVLRGFLGGHRWCWELNQLNRGILQTFKSRVSTKQKTDVQGYFVDWRFRSWFWQLLLMIKRELVACFSREGWIDRAITMTCMHAICLRKSLYHISAETGMSWNCMTLSCHRSLNCFYFQRELTIKDCPVVKRFSTNNLYSLYKLARSWAGLVWTQLVEGTCVNLMFVYMQSCKFIH